MKQLEDRVSKAQGCHAWLRSAVWLNYSMCTAITRDLARQLTCSAVHFAVQTSQTMEWPAKQMLKGLIAVDVDLGDNEGV